MRCVFHSTVEVPLIIVLNPETRVYYMLPASELSKSFNQEQLEEFLKDILNGKAVVRRRSKLLTFSCLSVVGHQEEVTSPLLLIIVFQKPLFQINSNFSRPMVEKRFQFGCGG
jgi:hypothetical protein